MEGRNINITERAHQDLLFAAAGIIHAAERMLHSPEQFEDRELLAQSVLRTGQGMLKQLEVVNSMQKKGCKPQRLFDLQKTIDSIDVTFRKEFAQNKCRLVVEPLGGLPVYVVGDADTTVRIIINTFCYLLNNFAPHEVRVKISSLAFANRLELNFDINGVRDADYVAPVPGNDNDLKEIKRDIQSIGGSLSFRSELLNCMFHIALPMRVEEELLIKKDMGKRYGFQRTVMLIDPMQSGCFDFYLSLLEEKEVDVRMPGAEESIDDITVEGIVEAIILNGEYQNSDRLVSHIHRKCSVPVILIGSKPNEENSLLVRWIRNPAPPKELIGVIDDLMSA